MKKLAEEVIQTATGMSLVGERQSDRIWKIWIGGDDFPNGSEEMGVFKISELYGDVTPEWLVEKSPELWADWLIENKK
jgi:hypothetical protein